MKNYTKSVVYCQTQKFFQLNLYWEKAKIWLLSTEWLALQCCIASVVLILQDIFSIFPGLFPFHSRVLSCLAHGISVTKIPRMLLTKSFWPSDTHQNGEICIGFHVDPDRTKVWNTGLNSKLFQLPTGLSWWYREKHYIDTKTRSLSCNKTSEQWCGEFTLLVNIKHDWDYILSAEDDTQEMEPKHCKKFT